MPKLLKRVNSYGWTDTNFGNDLILKTSLNLDHFCLVVECIIWYHNLCARTQNVRAMDILLIGSYTRLSCTLINGKL